jgi:hypothetical protein
MKHAPYIVFFLAAVVFFAGMSTLFDREIASGSVYPEYSSLRSDPDGAKLLYDSLARLPGITVDRSFVSLAGSPETKAAILVMGIDPERFDDFKRYIAPVESLALEGNRVVIAFHHRPGLAALKLPQMEKHWGIHVAEGRGRNFYFTKAEKWAPLEGEGERLTGIERAFGSGSVVLITDSAPFSNHAILESEDLDLVLDSIGPYQRVVFDEEHLGVAESGSIAGMARRFHLTGIAAGLGICGFLFLWKSVSGFPPPSGARVESQSGIASQAGLVTLLQRHLGEGDLAPTCWRAWLETNRNRVSAQRISQAEAILREPPSQPLDTLRRIGAVLHSKGEL